MSDSQSPLRRRHFLKASGASAVSLGLAGCSGQGGEKQGTGTEGASTSPTSAGEQVFTMGMAANPKGANRLSTSSSYSAVFLDLIYEAGTKLDPVNFEIHPNVYTEWTYEKLDETGENGEPNVKIYFNVRDGLTFNDGTELTLDDVVFTYEFMKEQRPGGYASVVKPIVDVKQSEKKDWDVELTLDKPVGTFAYQQLGLPILPKARWKDVDDYKAYKPSETEKGPVGLGPGVLKKYDPDTAVSVSFADREGEYTLSDLDWYDDVEGLTRGGPFVDEIRYKIFGSDAALNQAFLQGKVDTIFGGINSSKVSKVEKQAGKSLIGGSDSGYSYHAYNLRTTPLDDTTFRQVLGFALDDVYYIRNLLGGYAYEGDFVMPPGYKSVRPETGSDQKLLEGPSTQAFHFRQKEGAAGQVDVEAVRSFLTSGEVISGESGTFAGQDYPGSLTGVTASQTEAKHDYTFGSVESKILKDAGAKKELRVNGKTVTEINGGPLRMYMYPPKETPKQAELINTYVETLKKVGIPVEKQVMSFNTMIDKVYGQEDFDIYPMAWGDLSAFGVGSLYSLFHSDNADDHSKAEFGGEKKNTTTLLNNPMGYGLTEDATADDLISQAQSTMETEKRNQLARKAVEKIYLDFPTMVLNYDKIKWPVNSGYWTNFVEDIPSPGSSNIAFQFLQVKPKN